MEKKIIELRKQNIGIRTIAKTLGISIDKVRYYCKKHNLNGNRAGIRERNSEEKVMQIINKKYPRLEYIGGFDTVDGYLYLMCKDCGNIFKHSAQMLRESRTKKPRCELCYAISLDINAKRKAENDRIRKEEKEKERAYLARMREEELKTKTVKCKECGKEFKASGRIRYCSEECRRRSLNRKKEKRLSTNGEPDYSITLNKLIDRDKSICHICNRKVDVNDCKYIDGIFIAGKNYPSIDHVKPISKGGLHKWSNVKLAHMYCNTIKNDKLIYEENNGQLRLSV